MVEMRMKADTNTIGVKTYGLVFVAAALFLLGYLPILQTLVNVWLESDEYSHAFLVVPLVFYLVWTKRSILAKNSTRHAYWGLVLAVLSAPVYMFGLLADVRTILSLAMLMTLVGALVYLFGIKSVKDLFTPLLLLALLIPVPEQLYIKLTFPLQLKVSQASQFIIQGFGIPIFRQGNIMNLPTKSFEVVEACSGLRSMITLLTLSIIMGYFFLTRSASKLVLAAASVPTAILVNIIRVSVMVLLYHYFRLDLSEGVLHTITGLAVFVIALVILFLFQRVLELWETRSTSN